MSSSNVGFFPSELLEPDAKIPPTPADVAFVDPADFLEFGLVLFVEVDIVEVRAGLDVVSASETDCTTEIGGFNGREGCEGNVEGAEEEVFSICRSFASIAAILSSVFPGREPDFINDNVVGRCISVRRCFPEPPIDEDSYAGAWFAYVTTIFRPRRSLS